MESIENTSTSSFGNSMYKSMFEEPQSPGIPNYSLFPPLGSPTSEKFISTLSVVILVCFFSLLRLSAGPFLHPSGEARIAASSSFYFSLCSFLFLWVTSSTILTLLPHFSSHHYNGVTAAALFFPMTFLSIATLLFGRFSVRATFYFLIQSGIYSDERKVSMDSSNEYRTIGRRIKRKVPKMVAFHRPFRKLATSCSILSFVLSLLHAHCWSQSLSLFKIRKGQGAGAMCRAVFSPLASSENGADERTIWLLWGSAIVVMIVTYAHDEISGIHCHSDSKFSFRSRNLKKASEDGVPANGDIDYSSDETDEVVDSPSPPTNSFITRMHRIDEVPQDTLPMVPWLSLFAAHSVLDIFLQMKVFLGRVDARLMQPALDGIHSNNTNREKVDKSKMKDPSVLFSHLREKYPGCIYDYSRRERAANGGLWFDFMADCGDGFNSSYQVARLLAQPNINVNQDGKERKLPRGQFLVNGGDLSYPEPSEHSYEKRFFRTFEDAMAPPPSFRRRKIATDKSRIAVDGWDETKCFVDKAAEKIDGDEHLRYKGPSTFIVPGNHDWYDGLNTFTRFILYRDFLGGWLMPQRRSYFAIKLVEGWWIFGLDCALNADIDIEQFKFFADVADNAVGSSDSVIIVNHEPHWVTDHDGGRTGDASSERNIGELMESHLRGKVRLRLAGDLHHYTRHTATNMNVKTKSRRSRSFSLDRIGTRREQSPESSTNPQKLKPFMEVNKPELIVSGGGGAFLHGTNAYSKDIQVGSKRHNYTRVAAYPNEAVSTYLGWMNMYQFRWRGWRCDLIFAFLYQGLVSSLFPLCGVYDDYEEFNPSRNIPRFILWLMKTIGSLIVRVITSERFSLFCLISLLCIGLALQSPEHHIKPFQRYFLALCHVFVHIFAALSCLIFVQCMAEWTVKYDIVALSTSSPFTSPHGSLAGSLYGEYKTHFYPVLKNFTHHDSNPALVDFDSGTLPSMFRIMKVFIEYSRAGLYFLFTHVPLLKTTLKVFDLPTLVGQSHNDMCSHLCADGVECLWSHDPMRFQTISRGIFVPYVAGVTLYFIFVAVPMAGSIFGTWLAVSLNIFKSQCDLAFSSLQIQHYKNFVKLHIKENGELEVFAIGLKKVPIKWVKDPNFVDRHARRRKTFDPSWSLNHPSKWIPKKPAKNQDPRIIDYVCIPKRRIKKASLKTNVSGGPLNPRYFEFE